MRPLFRSFVAYSVIVSILLSGFTWPGQQAAMAATLTSGGTVAAHTGACNINDPNVAAGRVAGCRIAKSPSGATMAYSGVQWSTVAVLNKSATSGFDLSYLQGSQIELSGLRGAQMLGINPDQAADMVNTFPVGVPVVFARYNPGTADMRVDLFKTERTPQGLKLMNAVFSPHHGGLWAVNGAYAEPGMRRAGEFGVNPFARFANASDDVFHNIGMDGVQVVVGHAMRMVQSPVGLVASAEYRMNQWKTTKKSLLKKSTTVHIEGFAKPKWMMASSAQLQPSGSTAVICAKDMGEGVGCPSHYVAPAVVTFDTWEGGNLQEQEESLYYWQKTYSGWTVLAFVLLTFIAFAVIGAIAMSAGLISSPAQLSLVATAMESAGIATQISVLGMASIQAATYGVLAFASGASSLLDVQDGYGGKILADGVLTPQAAGSEHERELLARARNRMTVSRVEDSISAVKGTGYGNCDVKLSAEACAGSQSGFLPRSDSYQEQDYVQFYRDNGAATRYDSGIVGSPN